MAFIHDHRSSGGMPTTLLTALSISSRSAFQAGLSSSLYLSRACLRLSRLAFFV